MTDYEIRQYKDEDRDKFFDLYQDVLGQEKTDSWFAWKYEENPYVDHIPMMVPSVKENSLVRDPSLHFQFP